ncbi:radical SAM protein [Desulfoscipio sp. XC116]|uniref:radical SAM protein n=1 Tax=Desulfoscipio sp. XC116 TaxID=3144975 RepID=UPI00325A9E35
MRQDRARTVPDTIQVELTSRCPLKCPQCYNDPEPRDIDRDILAGYIKEAAGLKVGTIAMGGGEPLMYPHLEYIIKLVSSLGMFSLMATSGAGLSAVRIRELKKAGLYHLWVSLNGSTRAIHEQSRDGYHYAVEALHMLRGSGLNHGINWVARKDNVDDFPHLVELARKMKIGAITVLRLKPDAQKNAAAALDGAELARLGSYIKASRSEELQIYIEQCFSLLRISMYGDKVMYNGCPAGREYMAISADGKLLPCRHLYHHGEKWPGIADYWNNSRGLDRLRTTEENVAYPCSDCGHLPRCRTCRAVCEKLYGSFYAGEKDCSLFRERGERVV